MFLYYLTRRENTKIAFFTQMPEFNQWLLDFFNLFDSRLTLVLLYDFPNLVINAFSSGLLWGHGSGERKSSALQQWLPLTSHHPRILIPDGNGENSRN